MIPDFPTIAQMAELIKKRELSPVELVENRLERIECFDGKINSFIRVLHEEARLAARTAEAEIAAGNYKGPLHGIPIGLKDVYETAGIPTTAHSKILEHYVPAEDACVVHKLKQAGAIIMGKLSTHEFALGGPSFDLPWPPARNPWDTSRVPGGSSSGSGAAVSAGFVLGSMASDSGGSIRGPAAACGLAGMKPTYGLVSRRGILPLAFSLDCAGPMAWTAEDCAILLQVMAGYDSKDPTSVQVDIPCYSKELTSDVKGLRVALLRHFYMRDTESSPAVCGAMDQAVQTLQDLGCIVSEIEVMPLFDWAACGTILMTVEPYAIHEHNLRTRFTDFGEIFRGRMALAGLFTAADYIHATQRRRELIEEFDQVMCNFDLIVTATTLTEALKFEDCAKFSIFEKPSLTIPFNITGSPAISVCCGYTASGLPLGMQIVGQRFEDSKVLRLAHTYEQATSWHTLRPAMSHEKQHAPQ